MRAHHTSAAHIQRRAHPFINAQCLGSHSRTDNVDDRVNRAHFVEMNFLDVGVMYLRFSRA